MGSKDTTAGVMLVVVEIETVSDQTAATGTHVRSGACASASGGPRRSLFNGKWVACATYNIIGCKVNGLSEDDREYLYELAESLAHGTRTIYAGNPVKINARVQRFLAKKLVARRYINEGNVEIQMDDEVRDIILDMQRAHEKKQASAADAFPVLSGPVGQA